MLSTLHVRKYLESQLYLKSAYLIKEYITGACLSFTREQLKSKTIDLFLTLLSTCHLDSFACFTTLHVCYLTREWNNKENLHERSDVFFLFVNFLVNRTLVNKNFCLVQYIHFSFLKHFLHSETFNFQSWIKFVPQRRIFILKIFVPSINLRVSAR